LGVDDAAGVAAWAERARRRSQEGEPIDGDAAVAVESREHVAVEVATLRAGGEPGSIGTWRAFEAR
jgi:hypothetical protein